MRVVFDTNIFISAFVVRGSLGAAGLSFRATKAVRPLTSRSNTGRKNRPEAEGKFDQADEGDNRCFS